MRFLAPLVAWFGLLAVPALGADPIMPLDQVQRGMQCEGRSVFRGTDVETFGVEILDVISPAPGGGAGILFRAYGPNVDGTGLGPGFSGSPIYCPDGEGVMRNAGAVSSGVEDYGNDVALAAPIESILGTPPEAPARARPSTRAERHARPWSLPLTLSGIGPSVRRALWPAAQRRGLTLLAAPATGAQAPAAADLQPGSAMAASVSSGEVGLTAIGTVAYRDDANRIWAFGHPLDNAGPRSLLLETAFVHTVIESPLPNGETLGTYKLASPGATVGTVTFDGQFAIVGSIGAPPATTAVEVLARGDGRRLPRARSLVADESRLNYPSGLPALSLVTPVSVTDRAFAALGAGSGRSHGSLCMRIELRSPSRRMGFCNRYVGDGRGSGGPQLSMGGDAAIAASLLEEYERRHLDIARVRVTLALEHGMRFATIRKATAPRRVRRGQRVTVRLTVQAPRERAQRLSFRVTIPRSVKPGTRTLRLTGAPADPGEGSYGGLFSYALGARPSTHDEGFYEVGSPVTVPQLAKAVSSIHRYDGIRGTFRRPQGSSEEDEELAELLGFVDVPDESAGPPLYRHPRMRIGGAARIRFSVR